MADSAEKQDHKAVEGTGLEVLQSGNPLVERKNAQDVEIVRESFEPMDWESGSMPGTTGSVCIKPR